MLKLKEIALIYLYLAGNQVTDVVRGRTVKANFTASAKRIGIEPCLKEGKEFSYSKEDILKVFAKSIGKYSSLSLMRWEEILNLLEKVKNKESLEKNVTNLIRDEETPSRWHNKLKLELENTMSSGGSIRKNLKIYYEDLCEKLKGNINLHTGISIVMRHRELLRNFSKEKLPKKGIRVSLTEQGGYSNDLKASLRYFQIPSNIMAQYKLGQLTGVRDRLKNQKEVPLRTEEILLFLDKVFNSDNLLDRVIGAFLATGRRTEEILNTGIFRADRKSKNHLYMRGMAKKQDDTLEVHFPILYDDKIVLNTIKMIRSSGLSYLQLRDYLLTNYKDLFRGLHDLRKLYGVYSYVLFSSDDVHLNLWLNDVLGHDDNNLAVSFNYSEYKVPPFERK